MAKHPPLNALRYFEAAARHLSFAVAASELSVTPAAISQQIRLLEEAIGVKLFDRLPSGVTLTPSGLDYARGVRRALDEVDDATERVKHPERREPVRIRCQFTFGNSWLAPRLGEFRETFPAIDLIVSVESFSPDALAGNADLAVYYATASHKLYEQTPLLYGSFSAMAAPSLLARHAWPISAAKLAQSPLLHLSSSQQGWRDPTWIEWFSAAGVVIPQTLPGISLSRLHMVIQACKAGAGFALVNTAFAEQELANSELVVAHELQLSAHHAHQLIYRKDESREEVRTVRDWLLRLAQSQSERILY